MGSTPQPSTSYASSDLRDRLTAEQLPAMKLKAKEEEEARQARKRAKKSDKKKKAKEVKRQKKAMQPLGTDWAKDKESEKAAKPTPTPRPSTSGSSVAPPTPAPRTLAPYTIPRRTSTPTLASSSKTDMPASKRKNIASLNIPYLPKHHPLIVPTNLTRQIIDKAHINSTNIHCNTTLHKIFNHSNILSKFERQREIIGGAKGNSLKYSDIWTSIANSCQYLLKPNNPQTIPLTNIQVRTPPLQSPS